MVGILSYTSFSKADAAQVAQQWSSSDTLVLSVAIRADYELLSDQNALAF